MTHTDLIAAWSQFIANDGADYLLLMPSNEDACILIPADNAVLFASTQTLSIAQRKAYGERGARLGARTVVIVEGPPGKCFKTLVSVTDEA